MAEEKKEKKEKKKKDKGTTSDINGDGGKGGYVGGSGGSMIGGASVDSDTVAAFKSYEALVRKRTLAAGAINSNEEVGVLFDGSLEKLREGQEEHWSKRYVRLVYAKGGTKRELRIYHEKNKSEILDVLSLIPQNAETVVDVKSRGEVAWKALFIITYKKTGQAKTEHTFRANKNDVEDWVKALQLVIDNNDSNKIDLEIAKYKSKIHESESSNSNSNSHSNSNSNSSQSQSHDHSNSKEKGKKLLTRITSVKNLVGYKKKDDE